MPLKRKQIYLDAGSDRAIKNLAKATGLPEAEHIRRAVHAYIERNSQPATSDEVDPLLRLIGICDNVRGPRDAALRHDRYLYGRDR